MSPPYVSSSGEEENACEWEKKKYEKFPPTIFCKSLVSLIINLSSLNSFMLI